MKVCILGSGSAGNSCFVSSGNTRILIDAGLSVKTTRARLAEIDERLEDVDSICLTHTHLDHGGQLARLVKHGIRRGRAVPVWASEGTDALIDWDGIESPPVHVFKPGSSFMVGDIEVGTFTIPHDCESPVGFTLRSNGAKIGFAHDLGFLPDGARARFRGCDAILLEANHDTEMLRVGPYHPDLKLRISGRYGHMSNDAVFRYLDTDLPPDVRHVVLLHLSEENNLPELARQSAEEALKRRGIKAEVVVAEQNRRSEIICL